MLQCCSIYLSTSATAAAAKVATVAACSPRVAVVDTFTDAAYARSSIKIVGKPEALLAAVCAANDMALSIVDFSEAPHPAPHPRCGAVDMVAFMPLSDRKTSELVNDMKTCDILAWDLGSWMGSKGCPVLMYGARSARSLLCTRRQTSFFTSVNEQSSRAASSKLPFDFGPVTIPRRCGISVVGSQSYVTNFNIQISGCTLDECRRVAGHLRSALGIHVLALPHDGAQVEIGCNIQATETNDCISTELVLRTVQQLLPPEAILTRSYIVGLTPSQALSAAEQITSSTL
jgi:glutamate formiminotransferase